MESTGTRRGGRQRKTERTRENEYEGLQVSELDTDHPAYQRIGEGVEAAPKRYRY